MKRTVPLVFTAVVGFVLILSFFSPYTEWLGELASIIFDILAAIAFLLGGGNLLKMHLQKVSDRKAGWGYSLITVAAFLATLGIGLAKLGAPPAENQEFYGQTFAPLALADFPARFEVTATLPPSDHDKSPLPPAVREQATVTHKDGQTVIRFHGWLSGDQKKALLEYDETLEWRYAVEELAEKAAPPEEPKDIAGRVNYYADRGMLSFRGNLTDPRRAELEKLFPKSAAWQSAVGELTERARYATGIAVAEFPPGFNEQVAAEISDALEIDRVVDPGDGLTFDGPMSIKERDALDAQFPYALPLPPGSEGRKALVKQLTDRGPLSQEQRDTLDRFLNGLWTRKQLRTLLDGASKPEQVPKTAGEMLDEKRALEQQPGGRRVIDPTRTVGRDQPLNPRQVELLDEFFQQGDGSPQRIKELGKALTAAVATLAGGPGGQPVEDAESRANQRAADKQVAALDEFFAAAPTVGDRNKDLCLELLRAGELKPAQREWLLADYEKQVAWRAAIYNLFHRAHRTKYAWSGDFQASGTGFNWLYEYAFKPLTATMFAMLAFYVASAAFRAFRAKNIEAVLLLGTAFIILLGRTAAGAWLTGWFPDALSGLKIDNLTIIIMQYFNTAGNRAIMIGIALGIASTSLKVLLGIDRSYLGSGEE